MRCVGLFVLGIVLIGNAWPVGGIFCIVCALTMEGK